ncbi:LytTR family two component transcriptional regulator [Arcicella aurantiaca]|uniref:LytTR family two component transcriptional regulator n=1 Tax=Arcicella aurantiaca TaxID=591202 RepID=A0A316DHD9_9BACT|nr:LytTR family DNA-binding domain-containing protein [Arcicella aurantiaca]PWK17591.1 LytTR family two component transcriptional regulator [Arcicella aurantiaca]
MNEINIVILEDDPIDRIKIEIMISEFSSNKYNFKLIGMFEELDLLLEFVQKNTIDLIISDIFNNKTAVGIELLKKLGNSNIPVILITQSPDSEVYQQAKMHGDVHYLIKPFHKLTLQSTIENVINDFSKEQASLLLNKKHLFLKGNTNSIEKLAFDEIMYLEADGNYCFIHSINRKYIQKKSMTKILEDINDDSFVRIHHKFAINIKYIESLSSTFLMLNRGITLPIGKSFKKNLTTIIT